MSWRPLRIIAAIVSVSSMLLGSPTATAQTNYLTDLGAVAPGVGINNSGEVVLQNYIYSHGTLTALPSGFNGVAINASGEVLGSDSIYSNGTVTGIPQPPQSQLTLDYQAVGINDSGEILVNYQILDTDQVPYSYLDNHGILTDISGFGCSGNVSLGAINDSGLITGSAAAYPGCILANGYGYAFIYDTNTTVTTGLGIIGLGYAINASGEVTGYEFSPSAGAFLYSHDKLTVLPNTPKCSGNGINTSGFVVGTCPGTAFFYNSTTSDLNDRVSSSDPLKPYVTLKDARGINDSGLVIVNGTDSRDNLGHAYLMQLQLIKVLIYTSASKVTAGTPVTLTWTTSPSPSTGVTCIATGGSEADGWTGDIALNGKKTVTESTAGTYSYGVSCTVGSQKQQADTSVVVESGLVGGAPPPTSGGGAFDSLSLTFLIGTLALRRVRRKIRLPQ